MNSIEIEGRGFYKYLGKIALPIALQSLIGSSLNLVDNLMVGSLGELELAAVGVSMQLYFMAWMLMYGFSSGCSTFMSQFYGADDMGNIRKTLGFNATVCFAVGMLFFIAATFFPAQVLRIFTDIPEVIDAGIPYIRTGAWCFICISITVPVSYAFRSIQRPKIPLMTGVTAFAINTFMNYVLIFGNFGAPEMGVQGAALATAISRTVELSLNLIMLFRGSDHIGGTFNGFFGWGTDYMKRIVKNSIPTTLNETLWGLGTSMYVAAVARMGVTEYAAMQACTSIQNLFTMAAFSIGDAILILVGAELGRGNAERAYRMAKRMVKVGVFIGILFGASLILCADPIIGLFEFTEEGGAYAHQIIMVYGATMVFAIYSGINITGVLRSGGDTRFAMITEVSAVWLIGVPMAFAGALVFQWPVWLVILAIKSEELVKCCVLFKRFISKKWVRTVIHDMG